MGIRILFADTTDLVKMVRGTSPEKIIHRNLKTSYAWTVSPKSSAKNYYFKVNVFSIYTERFPEDYSSKSFREKC